MGGAECQIVSADTADLAAFVEAGGRYVGALQSIADRVSSARSRVVAATGRGELPGSSSGTTAAAATRDGMDELIAEAGLANAFASEVAAALATYSGAGTVAFVPAEVVDAALAGVGLDLVGQDRAAEDDQRTLAVRAARRELQAVMDEAGVGVPDHLRQNVVGRAVRGWLDSVGSADPDQAEVAALALLGEGIELQAGLDSRSSAAADGIDGGIAALLVVEGLLWWPAPPGALAEELAAPEARPTPGEATALQVMVDALDLDQSNQYLNSHGLAMSEAERTTQPWVRTNLLLALINGTIGDDGTISEAGQTLVDDVLDRYPSVIEQSTDLWHNTEPADRYHRTSAGAERRWVEQPATAVFGRALAAPNYGLTEEQYEAAVGLDALDGRLEAAVGSELAFNRLLVERFALVDDLAGGDQDLALLLDAAMARGLSATEALRLTRFGAAADGARGTDARVRRLRLVYPTTAWGDPIAPVEAVVEQGLAEEVARSLAVELGALQSIQAARFAEGLPTPAAPLTVAQVELVRRYAEVEQVLYHRYGWALGAREAVTELAAMDPDLRDQVLPNKPDGFERLLRALADPDNDDIWRVMAGAADNDTFLGPGGTFRRPGGEPSGRPGDAQALLGQLALLSMVGPHHERLDLDGDGVIHEDEVARWLEVNDGRPGVPPALVDQVRVGAEIGLGQDTFGWEEFGEIVGWVGLAAAATASIVYTGGAAAPLWVKGGLVGLAAVEAAAWVAAGDDLNAALAGTAIVADLAAATRLIRQARRAPVVGPAAVVETEPHRAALRAMASQSDNSSLRQLAELGESLPDDQFLEIYEAILDVEAAAIIQAAMRQGVSSAEAIAPFREAGMDLTRLRRFAFEPPTPGSVADSNFAQNNRVKAGKLFSRDGRMVISLQTGLKIDRVSDLTEALRAGTVLPHQVPVDYVVVQSHQLILNTRTSTALRNAGIPQSQWYGRDQSRTVAFVRNPDRKPTALYPGDPLNAEVVYDDLARAQLKRNGLPPEGSPRLGVDPS